MSIANDTSDHPFPDAPSPWHCKGELFWLLSYSGSTPYPGRATFGDLEVGSSWMDPAVTGGFKGGLQHVMIVRYKETPVGPYDEIVWSPGEFTVSPTGKSVQRITRIYVSDKKTLYAGRKNWNIPKHLAHFKFTPSDSTTPGALPYSRIEVASPSTPDEPFFVADLTPTSFLSWAVIPLNTKLPPLDHHLAHPPLPQSPNWREDAAVGTDQWCILSFLIKGKVGFLRCKGGLEGGKYGDNEGFPDVQPWSLGLWSGDCELSFVTEEHLEKKDQ